MSDPLPDPLSSLKGVVKSVLSVKPKAGSDDGDLTGDAAEKMQEPVRSALAAVRDLLLKDPPDISLADEICALHDEARSLSETGRQLLAVLVPFTEFLYGIAVNAPEAVAHKAFGALLATQKSPAFLYIKLQQMGLDPDGPFDKELEFLVKSGEEDTALFLASSIAETRNFSWQLRLIETYSDLKIGDIALSYAKTLIKGYVREPEKAAKVARMVKELGLSNDVQPPPQGLLDVKDVAQRLSVSTKAVYGMVKAGRLRAIKVTGKTLRFKPADVDEFLLGSGTGSVRRQHQWQLEV